MWGLQPQSPAVSYAYEKDMKKIGRMTKHLQNYQLIRGDSFLDQAFGFWVSFPQGWDNLQQAMLILTVIFQCLGEAQL